MFVLLEFLIMTQALDELTKKFQGLLTEWDKKNHDLNDCCARIKDITVMFFKIYFEVFFN